MDLWENGRVRQRLALILAFSWPRLCTLHAEFPSEFSYFHVLSSDISTHVNRDYPGHPEYKAPYIASLALAHIHTHSLYACLFYTFVSYTEHVCTCPVPVCMCTCLSAYSDFVHFAIVCGHLIALLSFQWSGS